MSIEVNATEQIIEVNATDTSIDINITNQVVDVNATTSVINVDASNGPGPQGPQGPAGQGVPVGGTTNQVLAKASGTNYDTQWVNAGVGSVTSVDASGGVGISVTGGPIVSSGTFTITNTAPDQVISITGSGGTSVTGTYPNFTISSNNLSGFVPYTGATQNVDLGEYEIKAGQFTLDTSPTGTATVGTTRWNNTIGSTETTLKGGNVILKNGVDLVARVVNKVTPNTTLTKAAYQAVRVTGAQGQRLAVAYAQANNDNNSADTIGLVTETIPTNQEGFIITVGQLEEINTTGSLQGETWSDGDVLYLSPTTPGALTNVKPVAPQHLVVIGYVEYAHAIHGKIYVKVMNGWELGELHDVNTTGAVAGNVLKYNGTIWTPSSDIDTGITSLNGLTALSQTFATGTSGTDFNISSSTSTHTFNLPTASATNRGALTSVDWAIFNGKENVLTFNSPLSRATNTISIPVATSSVNGYLSSTDWTTFNNKQNAGNYITALTGEVTAIGPGSASATLLNSAVTGKLLTGLNLTGGGTILATDSILQAFGKTQNQISALVGGVMYEGVWNANTNSPAIVSGVGSKGDYYVVNVAGSTNIDGITDWKVGDWIIFNGTTWDKVDNTDAVSSVNGFTGAVSLSTSNIAEGTNLYFTNLRAQNAITLTTSGTSGAATYTSGTLNIPAYTLSGLGGVPTSRTLTINGTSYDLSADRSYSVGTVTSVNMSVPTGFAISGNPITSSGTLALAFASGYSLPTTSSQANWDAAYNDKINSASVTGTTTKTLTLTQQDGGTITASWTDDNTDAVTSVFGRTGAVVAQSGDYTTTQVTEGTNLYYTDARSRAALSFVAGSGAYNSTTGVITIPTNTNQLTNGASFITLASLSGGAGISYNNTTGVIASTITQYTDAMARASISGGTGISYNSTTGVITNTITQYTDAMARASLSFSAGSGAYNSTTGVITIPTNTNQLTNGAAFITLGSLSASAPLSYNNGTGAFTISQANSTTNGFLSSTDWNTFNNKQNAITLTTTGTSGAATLVGATLNIPQYADQFVGTVTSVAALTIGTTGTDLSSTVANSTTTPVITLNVPTASATNRGALSAADWNTFNNKQNALTNPVTGTGTTNYVTKWTSSSAVGNSQIFDNGTSVGIGTTSPSQKLEVAGTIRGEVVNCYGSTDPASTSPYLYSPSTGALGIGANGSERMRLTSGGNLLVGTTSDSGYELQVSGSVQTRDGGGFVADLGSTVGAAFVASNQSLTGSSTTALVSLQTTWNTTGNADAIYLNVTNTASGAASKLLDLRVDGGSIFRVQRNGRINASSLPTSSAGLSAGDIWNDGGTLKIV